MFVANQIWENNEFTIFTSCSHFKLPQKKGILLDIRISIQRTVIKCYKIELPIYSQQEVKVKVETQ